MPTGNTRKLILIALARDEELYGYRVQDRLNTVDSDENSPPSRSAIYGALKRLANEGLIEAVRTERGGNHPYRTIYRLTDSGRKGLHRASE